MPLDQGVKKKSLETNKIREHMNTQEVARSTQTFEENSENPCKKPTEEKLSKERVR